MCKRILLSVLIASSAFFPAFPQTDARESYEKFRQQVLGQYDDFRNEANRRYADFLRQAWEAYQQEPAIPKPKDEKQPPVVMPDKDRDKPVEDKPVTIEEVVSPPEPQPQPQPIAPVREQPNVEERTVAFSYCHTECKVRFPTRCTLSLAKCDKHALADAWGKLSATDYDNTIKDCLELRERYRLCDWAYLQLLHLMAETCLGKTNEATLLTAFIFSQSGYDMKLGLAGGNVCLLFASRHMIYDMGYFKVNGKQYYPLEPSKGGMLICDAVFPEGKPLDLTITRTMSLSFDATTPRIIKSKRFPEVNASVSTNRNLMNFYNSFPSSMTDNDFMTRWAIYANSPMDEETKKQLYGCIAPSVAGLSAKEATERLLNFVQTGFEYEYDDKVWGQDRAFFAEETLFYPYCDCEDRSILFSRLVRDLLGLKVVLVYYPGHLATAVKLEENVAGDYMVIGNDRFTVCDPTYIGAPVGRTMPGMDNQTARVIMLH